MPDRRGKVEVVTDLLFLGSRIIVDGDCSHEIRRWLLLSRKVMTNLDSVLKSRDITLLIKGPYSQGYSLPSGHVQVWELDHKEGRTQRIDAFELWCPRRLLKVPWTARESNQSMIREINPLYSLEGLMLRLRLQYFGHLMQTGDSLEKSLMLRKIEGKRGRENQKMSWLDGTLMQGTWTWVNFMRWWEGGLACFSPWGGKESDMTGWLNNNDDYILDIFIRYILMCLLFIYLHWKIPLKCLFYLKKKIDRLSYF